MRARYAAGLYIATCMHAATLGIVHLLRYLETCTEHMKNCRHEVNWYISFQYKYKLYLLSVVNFIIFFYSKQCFISILFIEIL